MEMRAESAVRPGYGRSSRIGGAHKLSNCPVHDDLTFVRLEIKLPVRIGWCCPPRGSERWLRPKEPAHKLWFETFRTPRDGRRCFEPARTNERMPSFTIPMQQDWPGKWAWTSPTPSRQETAM